MKAGKTNLRRSTSSRSENISAINTMNTSTLPSSNKLEREKKTTISSLSLSCRRWMVRFLTLRKSSQVVTFVMSISLLILTGKTIELMSSSSIFISSIDIDAPRIRNIKKDRKDRKDRAPIRNNNVENVEGNHQIYDKFGIHTPESLQRFINRKTFPPFEPRVVRLTDKNHTLKFSYPPGDVTAWSRKEGTSKMAFPLPEKGVRQLPSRYFPLRLKNPKPLSAPTPLGSTTGNCEAVEPSWQLAYHPTCNQIHEASTGWQNPYHIPKQGDDRSKHTKSDDLQHREQLRLVNYGAFRHVWMIRDAHDGITKRAMKTLRSLKSKEKKFDLRNHDRHRRDAVSFEQLHSSPLVVDLYASCSNTAIFDYADRGDLLDIFSHDDGRNGKMGETTHEASDQYKHHIMEIAYNVSMSVHHAHHFNAEGLPTMAHTDIKTDQFIYQDGYYKLSDFNRVRFLTWDFIANEQCGFNVGKNGGEYRSPEEYAYKPETEKVDVYSLGNVLYFLLVREEVWNKLKRNHIYDYVKKGQRPKVPDKIYKSEGIFERHMIQAMEAAWIHEPERRPGALQVANIIKEGLDILSQRTK